MKTVRALIGLIAVTVAGLAAASPASADSQTFRNPGKIAIPTKGKANPNPSGINVSGMSGRVTGVVMSLDNFSHARPDSVDVLLVAPDGTASIVMSDSCGTQATAVNRLVLSMELGSLMPKAAKCDGLLYRPTDSPGDPITDDPDADAWPDAPGGPHTADFDRFIGGSPNGVWRLFVVDDRQFDGGEIAGGWSLTLTTQTVKAEIPGPGAPSQANPYPIGKDVTGVEGTVTDVNVRLGGVFHEKTSDLDMVLVGPGGQSVVLMSDACGGLRAINRFWGWDDEARTAMDAGAACPTSTAYKPTDFEPGDALPGPAPAGPYGTALSALDGTDPNGRWNLYVTDDSTDAATGFFSQDFELAITTRPKAEVAFGAGALTVDEGSTGTLVLRRSAASSLGRATVQLTSTAASAASGEDFDPVTAPVTFGAGQLEAKLPVRALADGRREGRETFTVSLTGATGDARTGTSVRAEVAIVDKTPTPGPKLRPGPNPARDRTAPRVTGFALSPARFASARRRPAGARGTTIRFRLSERARVVLRIERAATGRRVGRACRPATAKSRSRRRCVRWVAVGSVAHRGRSGGNRLAFKGRVGKRVLRPGLHRVSVRARDADGNLAVTQPRAFRVVG